MKSQPCYDGQRAVSIARPRRRSLQEKRVAQRDRTTLETKLIDNHINKCLVPIEGFTVIRFVVDATNRKLDLTGPTN